MTQGPDVAPRADRLAAGEDDPERSVREADAEIARGDFVKHERVREWLARLARGDHGPPPEPRAAPPPT